MATWTAPIPASPTLTALAPGAPACRAPLPAAPTVTIAAASIPYIQPVADAGFAGAGVWAVPYTPSMPIVLALRGAGFWALLFPAWTMTITPAAGTTGALGARVAVGSGNVLVTAAFSGTGCLHRTNAPFGTEGYFSAPPVLSVPYVAAFSGAGGLAGAKGLGAAFSGAGAMGPGVIAVASIPAPPAAEGTLTVILVVDGAAVVAAGFGGEGSGADRTSAHALLPALFTGTGTTSTTLGGPSGFGADGELVALVGVPAAFAATGTDTSTVVFAAPFSGEARTAFTVVPHAPFFGSGALSVLMVPSVTEVYSQNGFGALSGDPGVPAAFNGEGTYYPTEWLEVDASASGQGTAAVAVEWTEQEAGAFEGVGTLAVIVSVSGHGAAFAMAYDALDPVRLTAQNEAYAALFAPAGPDENHVG